VDRLSRRVLEDLWRLRLEDARERLDLARTYSAEVRQIFPPDQAKAEGDFALQRAPCAENAALAHYVRVLRIFTDLVVDGTVPDEGAWQRSKAAHAV
jgi:hypothetical protein